MLMTSSLQGTTPLFFTVLLVSFILNSLLRIWVLWVTSLVLKLPPQLMVSLLVN
jgi:hypothetical protein